MSTYKAWDGNDYPLPTPEGWYQGSDQLWWPEGYGPGPATAPSPAAPPTPAYEAPVAEAPAFDSDPTTILPTAPAAPVGGTIPGHAMPAPGAYDPSASSFSPPPATDQWSQPPGAAPGGFEAPPAQPAEWSQPPGGEAPGHGSQTPSGSSSKLPLIAGAALLALVVIGGLAFAFTRGGDGGGEVVAFDPTAEKGSAANPHTPGDLVRISYDSSAGDRVEWSIEVQDRPVDSSAGGGDDADATVQMRVSLTQAGAPEALSVLSFTAVSPDGKRTENGGCGSLTSPLDLNRLVTIDETAEGQVCWQVPAADLGAISMMVEVDGIAGAVYMELQ